MEYLLKASAVLIIFYAFYVLWLQKETFFTANRWFLLSGILLACCLPFVIIPVYVDATPNTFNFDSFTTANTEQHVSQVELLDIALITYMIGIVVCLGRFFIELTSLKQFIFKQKSTKKAGYLFIETKEDISPFSFFNRIVYNPTQFTTSELEHIVSHEKVHAQQYHSLDIILVKLATIIFWFNPVVWLYKKALIQNLEFIADRKALQQSNSSKSYQNLLLKTSLPPHHMALTTNFYNSLIKKRIIMLHKSNSRTINTFKYACIIPLLLMFLVSFNTKTVYNNSIAPISGLDKPILTDGELIGMITKDDSDMQLETLINTFKSQDVILKIKHVKRNSANEIIAIAIDARSESKKLQYNTDSDTPISPIKISFNNATNELAVKESKTDSKVFFTASKNAKFVNTDDDNAFVIHTSDGASSFVVKKLEDGNKDRNIMFISEDGKTTHVTSTSEDMTWINEQGETVEIEKTVNSENKELKIVSKDGNGDPLYFVNGKKITKAEMNTINPNTIESINVLKGEKAIEKYGEEAKNGVIEITLKN